MGRSWTVMKQTYETMFIWYFFRTHPEGLINPNAFLPVPISYISPLLLTLFEDKKPKY
jgi:hypothetical protein